MVSGKPLEEIPGVGKEIAKDLRALGFKFGEDLKNQNPEKMYTALCRRQGKVDRCMLYVFRCAVYYVSHTKHKPELLKWWNWKDR